jgi:opacity protein-like surface antigen
MKKYLLTFSISLISICTSGQTLIVIPKIGATIATVSTSETDVMQFPGFEEEIKSRVGFTLGAALNYSFNDKLSVQPELNFIQKGYQESFSSTLIEDFEGQIITYTNSSTTKYTLNYLEIPVLAKLSFGGETKVYAIAGPSVGIGLGGKFKYDNETIESSDDFEETYSNSGKGKIKFGEASENYEGDDLFIDNRIDFGIQVGAGILIAHKIIIEARYGLGLSSLYDSEYEVKNRVFQFTIGMPLTLR